MRLIRLLKRDLATEVATWVEREIISVDQARSICRLYEVDYDAIRSRSTGYRVLVVLGFLFIGLALITVIGANWDEIPRAARMAGTARPDGRNPCPCAAPPSPRPDLARHRAVLPRKPVLRRVDHPRRPDLPPRRAHAGRRVLVGAREPAVRGPPVQPVAHPHERPPRAHLALPGVHDGVLECHVRHLRLSAVPRGRALRAGAGASEHPPVPRRSSPASSSGSRTRSPRFGRMAGDAWSGRKSMSSWGRRCSSWPGRPGNGSTQGKVPGQGTTEPCSPSGPCASPSSGCSS